ERFGIALVVVIGHTHCGAVQAAVDSFLSPEHAPTRSVMSIVDRIRPAIAPLLESHPGAPSAELMRSCMRANVRTAAHHIRRGTRRPMLLKRYVDGIEAEPFYQKRVPAKRPDWVETATYTFPSGRVAEEIVVNDVAQLAWVVNLGCVDLHPHPIRKDDMDRP